MTDCELKCTLEMEFDKLMLLTKPEDENAETLSIQEVLMSDGAPDEHYEGHATKIKKLEDIELTVDQTIVKRNENAFEMNKIMSDIINDIINDNISHLATGQAGEGATSTSISLEKIKTSTGSHNIFSKFYRKTISRRSIQKEHSVETSESEDDIIKDNIVVKLSGEDVSAAEPVEASPKVVASSPRLKKKKSATMPRNLEAPRQQQPSCWTSFRKHLRFFVRSKEENSAK